MNKLAITVIIVIIAIAAIAIYFVLFSSQKPQTISPADNQTSEKPTARSFEIQGMKVEVLREGSGSFEAKDGKTVTVHYIGTLTDGTKFDSSVDRNAPFTFTLGENRVIKGWELGVAGMKLGEKRKLTIPSELAYGPRGFLGKIPPNATLIYEVEVLRID